MNLKDDENKIILYTTDDGKSQVSLMSRDGRIWLNQKQMAELFAVTKMSISLHIANILKDKELDESVVKYFFTTAADGKRYNVSYYALEMILAVGFRVRGVRGTQFRQWANAHLSEYEVLDGPGLVSHEEAVALSSERYETFDDIRRKEEARLADEADMQELRRIEDAAKKRGKKA